jgi:FkbM family methyltransferase
LSEIQTAWHRLAFKVRTLLPGEIYTYESVRVPVYATPELRSIWPSLIAKTYESSELCALRALLRSDDIVVEFGAGCGVVSAFIAGRLSASGNLHCYEANASLRSSFEAVSAANGVAPQLVNAAVGSADGVTTFYISQSTFQSSSTVDRGRNVRVDVPQLAIGRILDEVRPTFIMMDVEGGEKDFTETQFPSHIRAICGEFHPHIIGDESVSAIVENLLGQGFRLLLDQSSDRVLAFQRDMTSH